jgi:glucose/arabinose dehydrogenase/mono/diheme cytochrome c family protein
MSPPRRRFPSPCLLLVLLLSAWPETRAKSATEGAALYQRHCALCHGLQGAGVPGVFPPLAGSDFLRNERDKALLAPLEGLSGKIKVNGRTYQGVMPPVMLDDDQLVAVFGHVFSSWGNTEKAPDRAEISALRSKSKYRSFGALNAALASNPLPTPPAGWELSVAIELGFSPARMAAHPDGERVLVLGVNGDIWAWNPADNGLVLVFGGAAYIDASLGDATTTGLTVDRRGRLYVVANQQNLRTRPVRNEVTIFRAAAGSKDHPWDKPVPWLRTNYPFGVGPYNHGVSHIAQGPDGMLYVNSGSRTDGGETGIQPNYATTGEEPITACLWRLDPETETPSVEVFARGLRNSYGFCWDADGHLLATENGPDADAAEELNLIEHGRHYGFPFQFSDLTTNAYPHTPATPEGMVVTKPFRNVGPDAGGGAGGLSTFDPHSCPLGIVWLEPDWPAPLGGSFLATRFGNLLAREKDTGFDLVRMQPDFQTRTTTVTRVLAPLARPIDLLKLPGHRLVIAEFSHGTSLAAGTGTPGRLLILSPKPKEK